MLDDVIKNISDDMQLLYSFQFLYNFFESRKIYELNNLFVLKCIECLDYIKKYLILK